ncbi:ketol-acid reductoisomerase [Planktomarina sp.]|nr:ketol-acid reductoisomerase [Planktomarina sp.]
MSLEAIYFDEKRKRILFGKTVAVLGYGSQGRAQSLNLRDSGLDVRVANREDSYCEKAVSDGFKVHSFEAAVEGADLVLMLVPDHAQPEIYSLIEPRLKLGAMLVVSHGFSLHFGSVIPKPTMDVAILAPRMPGKPIRESYLAGEGIPAFYGVVNNASGVCENKVLSLADNLGYTKKGVIATSLREETEVDLFIEQFLLPRMIHLLEQSFDFLLRNDVSPEVAHMEVYSSGELADLLKIASQEGLYDAWKNHASPTCRFGIYKGIERCEQKTNYEDEMTETLKGIRNGTFVEMLRKEYASNLDNLSSFDLANSKKAISQTQLKIKKLFN